MTGISLSWILTTHAIAHKLDIMPLPQGTNEAEVGRWRMVVNNSRLDLTHSRPDKPDVELPPFEVYVEHLDYLAFGLIGPAGGMIGGIPESQLIADMVAYLPPSVTAELVDEHGPNKDLN